VPWITPAVVPDIRAKAPIEVGTEETTAGRICTVAVGAEDVLGAATVATSDWFSGTGLLTITAVGVSSASTGVTVGTMGVPVGTTGMGLGRLVTGVAAAPARGVGVAADFVGVAATTAGFPPQLASSKALATNRMKIE
jgi:hypothetical protein